MRFKVQSVVYPPESIIIEMESQEFEKLVDQFRYIVFETKKDLFAFTDGGKVIHAKKAMT